MLLIFITKMNRKVLSDVVQCFTDIFITVLSVMFSYLRYESVVAQSHNQLQMLHYRVAESIFLCLSK
jgi:hypothetical protein